MQLRSLKSSEYRELYQLMKNENFPDTPKHFYEAQSFFENCLCYGKFSREGLLQAAFIFGDITPENAFVDIVCRYEQRGKWATKRTMKWLARTLFYDLALDYIWVNPQKKESLKLASKLGFKYVHGLDNLSPITMVLTKNNMTDKYFI